MSDESKDEELARDYLLGKLSESELQKVEERLMTDGEFSDLALVVESMLVEDYVEDELRGRDRESFEGLLLATPRGNEQVHFTRQLKEYASKAAPSASPVTPHRRSWRSAFGVPRWALAAAAVLLIAVGFGVWQVFFSESQVAKGLTALNKAYLERPVDVRITGLDHVPRTKLRGDAGERVDSVRLRQAEIILLDQARENPDAPSLHAAGRLYLSRKDFPGAINHFKKALELEPDDARIHSDLGAAFLEMGKAAERDKEGGGAEAFSQSREHLDKALELNPDLAEALFNRALLYQQMSLLPQAIEEWEQYLKKDSRSGWADEARRNIESIRSRNK